MPAAVPAAPDRLLVNQARWESNARTYPRNLPLALVGGQGIHLRATDGRRYLDCLAGAGTLSLGHNHPVVIEAIRSVLDSGLPLHTLDFPTPVKDRFVQDLLAQLPPGMAADARVHFCGPSGADAVEAAVKLVKLATGRRVILAFQGGYHGMTHGALAATGNLAVKSRLGGLATDMHFLPYPYAYRCPFGLGGQAGWRAGVAFVERLLDDPESGIAPPAGMLLEVVQGEGGSIPAPDPWLQAMRRLTAERGIPLIVDEVQTGLGRTGRLFAVEHAGIVPDVLVLSKAIGGGLPLALLVYSSALDRWPPGAHTGTFRGNQLAMAAGAAALRYTVAERLPAHAAAMGERLRTGLAAAQRAGGCIGEVRGRGLMLGVEIVEPDGEPDRCGARPTAGTLARRVQAECLRRGLIVELGGRHGAVVRFLPPLIVPLRKWTTSPSGSVPRSRPPNARTRRDLRGDSPPRPTSGTTPEWCDDQGRVVHASSTRASPAVRRRGGRGAARGERLSGGGRRRADRPVQRRPAAGAGRARGGRGPVPGGRPRLGRGARRSWPSGRAPRRRPDPPSLRRPPALPTACRGRGR
jgi:diaminobutyrate-2-oxoglutarate transaminase